MKKNSICRKIQLYKLPIKKAIDPGFDYLTFGHYDGFNTVTIENNFKALWENNQNDLNDSKMLDYQTFFLFHENKEKDDKFWEDCKESNFVFITFVHLEKGDIDVTRKSLENKYSNIICYRTLDNSDIIFVTYSDLYNDSVQMLMQIYANKNSANYKLNYIYTLFATSYNLIKNGVFNEKREILNDIMIRYMIRDISKIAEFNDTLIKSLGIQKKARIILGHDDCILVISEIHAKNLFSIYKNNAIFDMKENDLRKEAVYSTDLRISAEFDFDNLKSYKFIEGDFTNWCVKEYENLKSINTNQDLYINILAEILKGMSKLENSKLFDYTFLLLYYPIQMLIDKMINKTKDENYLSLDDVNNVFMFLDGAAEVLARSNYSSIQLFQIPVHPNKVYNAPGKLLSFYTAYLDEVSQLASKDEDIKNKYAFLVSPMLNSVTQVQIIFNGEPPQDRLLLVKTPAYTLFKPKELLFTLTHELYHFVGERDRNRELRLNYLIKAYISSIISAILSDDLFDVFSNYHMNDVNDELYHKLIDTFKDKFKEYSKQDYYLYSSQIYEFLLKTSLDFLKEYIIHEGFLCDFREKNNKAVDLYDIEFNKTEEKIYSLISQNYINFVKATNDENITTIISALIDLTRECYSDLASILLLNVSLEDYYKYLIDLFECKGDVKLENSMPLLSRIQLITDCMIKHDIWESNQIAEVKVNNIEILKNIQTLRDEIEEENTIFLNKYYVFNKTELYDFYGKYMDACFHSLMEKILKYPNDVKGIRDLYNSFDDNTFDFVDFSKRSDELITRFRNKIREELRDSYLDN